MEIDIDRDRHADGQRKTDRDRQIDQQRNRQTDRNSMDAWAICNVLSTK